MVEVIAVIVLTAATVLVHATGTYGLVAGLRRKWPRNRMHLAPIRLHLVLTRVVLALFLLHVIEAALWAGFYVWSGALPDFHTAMYFSVSSYTTVGYGDVVLDDQWRLLGAFESCIGVLMLGWSTGILFALVSSQFVEHGPVRDPA